MTQIERSENWKEQPPNSGPLTNPKRDATMALENARWGTNKTSFKLSTGTIYTPPSISPQMAVTNDGEHKYIFKSYFSNILSGALKDFSCWAVSPRLR